MEVKVRREDLNRALSFLEREQQDEPSEDLLQLIERLHAIAVSGQSAIFFPSGTVEVDEAIMLLMSDEQLLAACRLNTYTAGLCRDDYFWKQRFIERLGVDIGDYLLAGESIKQAYLSLTNPMNDPLVVAANKGYIPILGSPSAHLTRKKAENLIKLISLATNKKGLTSIAFLDQRFSIFTQNGRLTQQVARRAVKEGNIEAINYLVSHVDPADESDVIWTIVRTASTEGREDIIATIVDSFPAAEADVIHSIVIAGVRKPKQGA